MTNSKEEIIREIERIRKQVEREVNHVLPRKVGAKAVSLFKENFRSSGFIDGGVTPWVKSKRQLAKGKDAKYPTLTSRRNHLMSSLQAEPSAGQVAITNPVPYAEIHNEGGTISSSINVSPKMRQYFWAMAYRSGLKNSRGKRNKKPIPPEAKKWLALALTKKTKFTIKSKIPQRKFMGDSRDIRDMVAQEVQDTIKNIKNGTPSK